jgi:hypothetical protein
VEDRDYLKRTLSTHQSCFLQSSIKRQRLNDNSSPITLVTKLPIIRRVPNDTKRHVLIIDTGGGVTPTITANAREALFFDKQNKNTLWADAIFKEMSGLRPEGRMAIRTNAHDI